MSLARERWYAERRASGVQPELHGNGDLAADGLAFLLSGLPLGHVAKDTYGFAVDLGVDGLHYLDVGDGAVLLDDELRDDTSLNAGFLCLKGVDGCCWRGISSVSLKACPAVWSARERVFRWGEVKVPKVQQFHLTAGRVTCPVGG